MSFMDTSAQNNLVTVHLLHLNFFVSQCHDRVGLYFVWWASILI